MKTSARFGQKLLELIVFGLLYHSISPLFVPLRLEGEQKYLFSPNRGVMRPASRLPSPVMDLYLFHVAVPQRRHSRILLHDNAGKLRWAEVSKQVA